MNKWLTLLLFTCTTALCQERLPLVGRVLAGAMAAEGFFVINKATGAEVKTDAAGNFTLPAIAGDKIAVYSSKINVRDFTISDASFKEMPYMLEVEEKSYELEEVVIQGSAITSESLGIVPKDQKKYTVQERRIYTATQGTDALFNALSGRTSMLKKAAETEAKESVIERLNGMFTDQEIIDQFKIAAENTKGFIFYVAEDIQLANALKENNEGIIKLLLTGLAEKYLAASKE